MDRPKVSVLITFYNQETCVDETLQSVLAQKTAFPFEVICGDDGSQDATAARIRRWTEKEPDRVTMLVMERDPAHPHTRNERVSAIRKRLARAAAGEYFLFLDGDDLFGDESKLQKQADVLDADTAHRYVACGHNGDYYWPADGRREPIRGPLPECGLTAQEYWSFLYVHTNALLFRNLYRQGIDPFASGLTVDDNLLTFQMIQYGGVYYLPERMFLYRQVAGSDFHSFTGYQIDLLNALSLYVERSRARRFWAASRVRHLDEWERLYAARRDPQLAAEARPYRDRFRAQKAGRLWRIATYAAAPAWKRLWCDLEWPVNHLIDRICRKRIWQGKVRALLEQERRDLEKAAGKKTAQREV